jgi:CRP-like cAMP-binding protein
MHDALLLFIRRLITLTSVEEDLLRQWFVPETVPKGGFFLQPGEISRKMGFVVQGVFHYFQSGDGQRLTYSFGREQEFIGDYESFFSAQPATHGIQALEDARLLSISYDNHEDFTKHQVIDVFSKQISAEEQQASASDGPKKEAANELSIAAAAVKSSYTLSGAEATLIRSLLMEQDVQMTPRQIRIYYYRYLLARNMLLKRLKLLGIMINSTLAREVLLRVLLVHFFQDTITIATAKRQVYAAQEDGPIPSLGPDSTYRLTKREMLEIYAVTELVTGY